jgi:hypothetical protein
MYDTNPKERSVVRASTYRDPVSGNVTSYKWVRSGVRRDFSRAEPASGTLAYEMRMADSPKFRKKLCLESRKQMIWKRPCTCLKMQRREEVKSSEVKSIGSPARAPFPALPKNRSSR